jgi:hypothetical protein
MERREEVKVRSGKEYDHLFPKALLTIITEKKNATVADTIKFIPQVVRETLFHTQQIAQVLKAGSIRETCRNIWDFVYDHIAYKKDEDGKEQIRSPARTWHDRGNSMGVDCDCYTTFISSILSNLKIRHTLRITKYTEDHFQHIYPIVPLANGTYITIDCVVRHFDYEEPYSEKKDTKMELEYLNGVYDTSKNIDAQDLLAANPHLGESGDLGKLFQNINPFKSTSGGGGVLDKLKEIGHKALNVTNIINPATAILRAGVLAAMKLNVFKIAQRLKYAYLSDQDAQSKGVDMPKFQKLKSVREKIEKIYYNAGGKIEALKDAILKGRGNKGKEVSGLGQIGTQQPLSRILGADLYNSEVLHGLGALGEPYSATAAITAATAALTAIALLLKSIGSIFPPKKKGSEDFQNVDNATANTNASDAPSSLDEATWDINTTTPSVQTKPAVTIKNSASTSLSPSGAQDFTVSPTRQTDQSSSQSPAVEPTADKPPGFWEKNKKWLLPTSIGAGVLALGYAGFRMIKKNKPEPKVRTGHAVAGIPKSKKQKKKGGKKAGIKSTKNKKHTVELL